MSKVVKFYISDFRNFHSIVNSHIRSKEDIIRILLLSLKMILLKDQLRDEGKGEASIIIDKSSRIYFTCKEQDELSNKYYSFVFPFFLESNSSDEWIIKCKITSEIINTDLIDQLLVLLEKGWFSDHNINSDDLDKFACEYLDVIEEYYTSKNIVNDDIYNLDIAHWSIIKTLLTFEPSYIRYDYDPEDRPNHTENSHPLHHLDVHYTTSGTFKLGFDKSILSSERLELNTFKDILENGKARDNTCYRLK